MALDKPAITKLRSKLVVTTRDGSAVNADITAAANRAYSNFRQHSSGVFFYDDVTTGAKVEYHAAENLVIVDSAEVSRLGAPHLNSIFYREWDKVNRVFVYRRVGIPATSRFYIDHQKTHMRTSMYTAMAYKRMAVMYPTNVTQFHPIFYVGGMLKTASEAFTFIGRERKNNVPIPHNSVQDTTPFDYTNTDAAYIKARKIDKHDTVYAAVRSGRYAFVVDLVNGPILRFSKMNSDVAYVTLEGLYYNKQLPFSRDVDGSLRITGSISDDRNLNLINLNVGTWTQADGVYTDTFADKIAFPRYEPRPFESGRAYLDNYLLQSVDVAYDYGPLIEEKIPSVSNVPPPGLSVVPSTYSHDGKIYFQETVHWTVEKAVFYEEFSGGGGRNLVAEYATVPAGNFLLQSNGRNGVWGAVGTNLESVQYSKAPTGYSAPAIRPSAVTMSFRTQTSITEELTGETSVNVSAYSYPSVTWFGSFVIHPDGSSTPPIPALDSMANGVSTTTSGTDYTAAVDGSVHTVSIFGVRHTVATLSTASVRYEASALSYAFALGWGQGSEYSKGSYQDTPVQRHGFGGSFAPAGYKADAGTSAPSATTVLSGRSITFTPTAGHLSSPHTAFLDVGLFLDDVSAPPVSLGGLNILGRRGTRRNVHAVGKSMLPFTPTPAPTDVLAVNCIVENKSTSYFDVNSNGAGASGGVTHDARAHMQIGDNLGTSEAFSTGVPSWCARPYFSVVNDKILNSCGLFDVGSYGLATANDPSGDVKELTYWPALDVSMYSTFLGRSGAVPTYVDALRPVFIFVDPLPDRTFYCVVQAKSNWATVRQTEPATSLTEVWATNMTAQNEVATSAVEVFVAAADEMLTAAGPDAAESQGVYVLAHGGVVKL